MGASCIDILVQGVDQQRFFSGKYKAERILSSFGGDALNEAVVLAAFDEDVKLSTLLGDDPAGKQISDFLKSKHVGINQSDMKKGIETYLSLVLINDNGDRCFVGPENGSLRLYDGSDMIVDHDCRIVSFASLFISKVLDDEKLYSLFSEIREHDVILCADTSTPKNGEKAWQLKCLSCLDHFFCNEAEAKALCDTEDLFECERIFYDAGVGDVIIKLGEKGCLNKGKIIAPERKIWCIDSTGAGDSFVAGYLHGLSLNLPVEERLHMANEFGGKACEHVGANKWIEAL